MTERASGQGRDYGGRLFRLTAEKVLYVPNDPITLTFSQPFCGNAR
jgi:hypothetical protein